MEHSCRKCLFSRTDLDNAETYSDIHADSHEARSDKMMYENYVESQEVGVTHVNGVKSKSIYHQFPFFDSSRQLPQC